MSVEPIITKKMLTIFLMPNFDILETQFKLIFIIICSKPGPASSVVERSLRKVCSPGDRGSNLAEDFSFQSQIYSQKGLMAISNYRTCYIVSRNLSNKQLLQQSVKRNVALEIGPMTSLTTLSNLG